MHQPRIMKVKGKVGLRIIFQRKGWDRLGSVGNRLRSSQVGLLIIFRDDVDADTK